MYAAEFLPLPFRHTPLHSPSSLAERCSYVSEFLPIECRGRWCKPFLSLVHKVFPGGPCLYFSFFLILCGNGRKSAEQRRKNQKRKQSGLWMTMSTWWETRLLREYEINLPYLSLWGSSVYLFKHLTLH